MTLETLNDLCLRFTSFYGEATYTKLEKLGAEDATERVQLDSATIFLNIPKCHRKPHFQEHIKALFPTPALLCSGQARRFVGAWLDHQPQCTKPVECGHRSLGALVASAGLAQPSSFITACDGFVCDRVHNVRTHAQGQSRRLEEIRGCITGRKRANV